jgi:hypothetical protein
MTPILAFAFQAASVLGVAAAPAAQWQDYEPPDRRFKVKLPAAPQEVHGQWDVYIASAGQTRFGIRVTPIHPEKAGASDVELYDSFQRSELNTTGGTITNSRTVTSGSVSGREFTLTGQCPYGACLLTYRVFRGPDRLFFLTVYASPENPDTAAAKTFLESFRIIRP